jgi:hypothetical protein
MLVIENYMIVVGKYIIVVENYMIVGENYVIIVVNYNIVFGSKAKSLPFVFFHFTQFQKITSFGLCSLISLIVRRKNVACGKNLKDRYVCFVWEEPKIRAESPSIHSFIRSTSSSPSLHSPGNAWRDKPSSSG